MNDVTKSITRRNFTAAAGLVSAGAVTTALASTAFASEPVPPANEVVWDEETDVLVAGFGAAGAGAASAAAEAGAQVLIIEKMDEKYAGGSSTCFANAWFPVVADTFRNTSFYRMDQATAEAREAASWEAFEGMFDRGLQMLPSGYEIDGGSKGFYQLLSTTTKEIPGITVEYETELDGLVRNDETGEVQGARARRGDKTVYIKANKGVVLTTGGYECNADLVHHLHLPLAPMAHAGGPSHTGLGLVAGMQVGAAVENFPKGMDWFEFAFRKASEETGVWLGYRWFGTDELLTGGQGEPFMYDDHIIVDMDGNRFMNELTYLTHDKTQLAFTDFAGNMFDAKRGYLHMPMFMVFDEAMMEDGPLGRVPSDHTEWTWNGVFHIHDWSDDNQDELERGWILKADTLEELAALMVSNDYWSGEELAVNAEGLMAAVEKWNAGCDAGADEFGRSTGLNKMLKPPYYAIELMPSSVYTISGLKNDINGSVVDWDGAPIARLYCAGNVGQSAAVTPIGVAACMGNGIIAGRHAAGLESWDA